MSMTEDTPPQSLSYHVSRETNVDYHQLALGIREEGFRRYVSGFDKIVFTNGCFDLFHAGHLHTLRHAYDLAGPNGAVVVGMNDDAGVSRLKGEGRPIVNIDNRAMLVVSLKYVDFVVTFTEDTPARLIEVLRPDVVVKGGDYEEADVISSGYPVSIAPYVEGLSTTDIIERVKKL